MYRKTTIGMIDPDDDHQPAFRRAPDYGVIFHLSPALYRFDPIRIIQRFAHLFACDPALGVVLFTSIPRPTSATGCPSPGMSRILFHW
jgi:hypothetical protein